MSRKFPGLRAAIITYLLIVVLGLGGVAAHALWSQSGTVTVTVTAGTWAPTGTVKNVQCMRGPTGDKTTVVNVAWDALDADKYQLVADAKDGGRASISGNAVRTDKRVSATLVLEFANESNNGRGKYTLTIIPMFGYKSGDPTKININLTGKSQEETTCTIQST
jgi:predicted ribosomally synthesized peptide with SipW-like signal peptide